MGSSRNQKYLPLHDPTYMEFAKNLREWREQAGLSQRQLAHLLGTTDSYVGKCERRDRRVDPIEMIRWCQACHIDPVKQFQQIAKKTRLLKSRA